MRLRLAPTLLLALAWSPPAGGQQVIGLLSLPEVFGAGACDRFEPGEVALHDAPESDLVVGVVRVDRHWTFHEGGGCQGLAVSVHDPESGDTDPLPVREYAYEAPGAVVLAERDGWFEVRLANRTGWVRASERAEFHPLEKLLEEGLTYLTEAWDGGLAGSPGGPSGDEPSGAGERGDGTGGSGATGRSRGTAHPAAAAGALGRTRPSVRVMGFDRSDDRLWIEVEVLSHSPCELREEALRVVARGWVPAHGAQGEPTVWFYSRGC